MWNTAPSLFPDGTPVSVLEPEGNLSYDRVFIYDSCEIKVEIQITEGGAFSQYRDVRLDLISAFSFTPESLGLVRGRTVYGRDARQFVRTVDVQKWGKLYQSEADLLCLYVTRPVHLLWAYRMASLMNYRTYFMSVYGIRINRKSADEGWESCFVPVDFCDMHLRESGVRLIEAHGGA